MKDEYLIACPEFGREGFEELLSIVANFEDYYRNRQLCFPVADGIRKAYEHLKESFDQNFPPTRE